MSFWRTTLIISEVSTTTIFSGLGLQCNKSPTNCVTFSGRLNVVMIDLPPLRDRKADIGLLAHHFLKQYSTQNNKTIKRISKEAFRLLENYDWPGNVRELENIIERATLFETSPEITPDSLPPVLTKPAGVSDHDIFSKDVKSLEQLSKKHIIKVLEMTAQNKTQASKLLGIDRSTLWRIMNRLKMN